MKNFYPLYLIGCKERVCRFFLLVTTTFLLATGAQAQITGTVFRDYNNNGLYETSTSYTEVGVAGVEVRVFNSAGTNVTNGSVQITNSAGAYSISPTTAGPFRLEFTLPTSLSTANFTSANGTDSRTSIQFISSSTATANFGISNPSDYCQTVAPPLVVPCFVSGDPLSTTTTVGGEVAIVSVPYNSSGTAIAGTYIATARQVGSVFGLAYQRETQKLFSAAFLKRHVGLGPAGLGGIYVNTLTNPSSASTTTTTYVDLENAPFSLNLGQSLISGRILPGNGTTASTDPLAFDAVGKVGLGGIALSSNGSTLYIVDLFNRQLLALNIGNPAKSSFTAADLTAIPLPTSASCTNGVARPFAVKVYQGRVYVGVVCTGENSGTDANLTASVYAMAEGATSLSSAAAFTFRLNYTKGRVHTQDAALGDQWETWTNTFAGINAGVVIGTGAVDNPYQQRHARPQPMFSDISFANNGDMIIGLMDRGGHQLGYRQRNTTNTTSSTLVNGYIGGDLLRASFNGSGWTLEANGSVSGLTSASGVGTSQGPGIATPTGYTGTSGEFFATENYVGVLTTGQPPVEIHQETYMGSSLVLPGLNQTVAITMDPLNVWSGGYTWFNNQTGIDSRRAQIYQSVGGSDPNPVTLGKANGLGGISAICDPSPLEIGNRIWRDTDRDGVQDAGEPGLAGVTVQLYQGSTLVSTTVTSATGEFFFNDSNVPGGLIPQTTYEVRLPISSATFSGSVLSPANNASVSDQIDSDATLVSNYGSVFYTTGFSGQNNHTLDIGIAPGDPDLRITKTVANTLVAQGASNVFTLTVQNIGTGVATNPVVRDVLDAGLTYVASSPTAGTVSGGTLTFALGTSLAVGATSTITVTVTAASTGVLFNVASVTATEPEAGTLANNNTARAGFAVPVYLCAGGTYTATLPASFSSVQFFQNGVPVASTGNSLLISQAGTYSYTALNTNCGAGGCPTFIVQNGTQQTLSVTPSSPTLCAGQSQNLTVSGCTNGAISWSNGQSGATILVNPSTTTTYTATCTPTSTSLCSSTVAVTVTVNPLPTATLTSATICAGQTTSLTATGGTLYNFGTGSSTNNTLTVSQATAGSYPYSVTVSSATGCTAVANATLTVNALPTPTLTPSSSSVCLGGSVTLNATGGTLYNFGTGATANSTLAVTPGSVGTIPYSVTVTNASGCTAVANTTVTVNALPTATLTPSSAQICLGNSATLTATGGTLYNFGSGATATNTLVVSPGTTGLFAYSVTVTNAQGCTALATTTVTVNALPTATLTLSSASICVGQSATLTATGGTLYNFGTGATTGNTLIVSPATAGSYSYSVVVTNGAGCTALAATTLTVNPVPTPTLTPSSTSICLGESVTLTATGGTGYNFGSGTTASNTFVATPGSVGTFPYSVTVTNAQGCSAVATTNVTVNALPTATLTPSSAQICLGSSATLTAGGDTLYNFGSGATATNTLVISPATTGTFAYSVTVTNAQGCTAVATTTVTVNASINAGLTASSASICAGASVTLTASGGTEYSFIGAFGADPNRVVSPSTTTTYSVTVRNGATSCTAVAATTVTVNPVPTPTLTASASAICAGGSATLTAGGAGTGGTYTFSGPGLTATGNTAVVPTSTPGTYAYSVVVTNSAGCTALTTTTLTVNPQPTATLTPSSQTICPGSSATLTAGGGVNYNFSGSGLTIFGNEAVATLSTAGTYAYSVVATNGLGCTAVANATVTVSPAVVVTLIPSSPDKCSGPTSVTLTANAPGATSYELSDGQVSTTGQFEVSPLQTTVYTVTATNGTTGCFGIAGTIVTVNPTPVVSITPSSVAICQNGSTTLTALSCTGTLLWSTGSTASSILVQAPASVSALLVQSYTVTCTASTGCAASASAVVTISPPDAITAVSNSPVCAGQTIELRATAGGSQYIWSGPNNFTANTATVTIPNATAANAGLYSVTLTGGTCDGVASVSVAVNALPIATLSSATICPDGAATLTATGGTFYLFSNGAETTGNTLTVSPNTTTTYSVTATNAAGCTALATGTVTVNQAPTATLSAPTVCVGGSATLIATGGTLYNFGSGATASNSLIVPTPTAGTFPYSVTVTNAQGCTAVATDILTVNVLPVANLLASPATLCLGESATLTASGGSGTLPYNFGGGTTASNTTVVTPTTTGLFTYSVTVTNALGCSAVANTTVTVNAPPTATLTLSSGSICVGQSVTLTATGGTLYNFGGGLTTGNTLVASPATAGSYSYSVVVSNASGCTALATATLTVNPVPSPTLTASSTGICLGESVTLTATGGTGYNFGTGLTASNTLVVTPGSVGSFPYSVTVVNAQGCAAVATANVTVNALPVVTLTPSSASICSGGSVTLTATGGTGYNFGTGITVSNTFVVTPGSAGSFPYSVTVTNASGCSAVATTTVTVNASIIAGLTLSNARICIGESATLTATGGTLFNFGGGNQTANFLIETPSAPGTYPYSVTVSNGTTGCSSTASALLTVNPLPVATLSSLTVCQGAPATLTATGGSTYAFAGPGVTAGTTSANTLSVPTTNAGSFVYSVTVTDGSTGCSSVTTATLTVNPAVTATLSSVSICEGQPALLTATGAGIGGTYAFSGPGVTTTGSTTANTLTVQLPAGSGTFLYSVTATNSFNCSAVATGTIVEQLAPLATLSSATVCVGESAQLIAAGGSSYAFSGPNITGVDTNTLTVATPTAGTFPYSVTVLNGAGCEAIANGILTVNNLPMVGLVSLTVCLNQPATLTVTGGTPGSTYAFAGPGVTTGTTSANTLSVPTTNAGSFVYSVTVTDGNTGCSSVTTATLTVNPAVVATLSSVSICDGAPVSLTATGGTLYQFSGPGLTITGSTTANVVAVNIPAGSGTFPYSVTVTDANGCSAVATATIVERAAPTPALSSLVVCLDEPTTLTAMGAGPGSTYLFGGPGITGALSQTANTLAVATNLPGTYPYSVTVTDANGCTAISNATVTVNPAVTATVNSANVCFGQSVTLTATGGTSYVFSGSGIVRTSGNTAVVAATVPGTYLYDVRVTDANGCTAITTATVTFYPPVTATLSSASICEGTSATLTASNSGGESYLLSGPGITNPTSTTDNVFVVTPVGTGEFLYTIRVTDAVGCTATAQGRVFKYSSPQVSLSSASICAGTSATLVATGAPANALYSFSGTDILTVANNQIVVEPPVAGTYPYSVTVTDANGCSAVSNAVLTVQGLPSVAITTLTCNGLSTYTVNFTATAGALVMANVGTVTGNQVTGIPSGQTVLLTATLNSCTATASATLDCRVNAASLGDFVWEDLNANGVQDAGEPPISGVTVTLYTNGSAVATTQTNANGLYSFTGLTPGIGYVVEFGAPAGFTATVANAGSDTGRDSNADPLTGRTASVTLAPGEVNPTIDAGFYRPASLGDYVFADNDQNGTPSPGDLPLSGVTVTLINNGTVVASTVTNPDGTYSFTGLTPGVPYSVSFTAPNGFTATTYPTGITNPVTLTSGENNATIDAGFFSPASLGNFVWSDTNRDGVQDTNEPGIPNVTVTLVRNGTAVATTTTDDNGFYNFTGLIPGVPYSVSFAAPANFSASPANQGGDDTTDSDVINGITSSLTLSPGENNPTLDAGFYPLRFDLALNKAVVSAPTPLLPGSLITYRITLTNEGELTAFNTLITDTPPAELSFSAANSPDFTSTGGVASATVAALAPGQSVTLTVAYTLATGTSTALTNQAEITSTSNDDVDSTPGNRAVAPDEDDTAIATIQPVQFAALGNFVWEDLNANGQQDSGEPGISNVTVSLLQNGVVLTTTTTNAGGLYSFTGLTPGVAYQVRFDAPVGFTSTVANTGNDVTDSDPDPITGLSQPVTMTGGETNNTLDAGFYRPASLGDQVFVDLNENGTQDTGEPALAGVTVTLVSNGTVVSSTVTNPDGTYSFTGLTPGVPYSVSFTAPNGFTATTYPTGISGSVTLASGESNNTLDAGFNSIPVYDLNLTKTIVSTGPYFPGSLITYEITVTNNSNRPVYNLRITDQLPTGLQFVSGTGFASTTANSLSALVAGPLSASGGTTSLTLTAMLNPNFTGTSLNNIAVVEAFTPTEDLNGPLLIDSDLTDNRDEVAVPIGQLASLGDQTFVDTNGDGIQNNSEPGLAGVTVTLVSNGTVVASTVTNPDGTYSFTGLTPGVPYSVSFTTPDGFTATTYPTGISAPVTLTAGEANTSVDAGFVPLQPALVLTKAVSTNRTTLGAVVSYTVTLANTGPVSATSIVVSDTASAGVLIVPGSASVSAGSFTPGMGGGTWAIASLPAGATATLVYSASLTTEGVSTNTASIPGQDASVCTTIPYRVCAGQPFGIRLGAPAGFSRYQWFLTAPGATTATLVSDGTLNSFTATLPGEYQVVIDEGIAGGCLQSTCCPFVIEETQVPLFTVLTRNPTCLGSTPQANGQLQVTGLGTDAGTRYSYQYSAGTSFDGALAVPTSVTALPADGILASNLPEGNYTVRITDVQTGCFRDVTVALTANCTCPEDICVPITIKKTKSLGKGL
ncbi:DUF11 domain-containing protein [Rudanella paleaurantiibacter]|uniref:DUF11 domain-containing protein n=1 Tax=Rudanella paleaurantiibacter TaxID=2614655 RepID=A0A7J5U0K7_9BACT|nr:SdrD B-like domain-containing protein [Rudanella paleaurantiibacter]KAB7731293.1 DUF11 domain-containing protein [Rudanella paleaurantiibacter]